MRQVFIFHTGETTCSENPGYAGSMCPFSFARSFGTKHVCHLFDYAPLHDKDGWLQRLPECVEAFRGVQEGLPQKLTIGE